MPILDHIRAHGGEVIRDGWSIALRKGRMTSETIAWVRDHKTDLMREIWPEFDEFEERAAIMEFDGGMTRSDAETAAYAEVMQC
ncbi:hypothetical protein E2974_12445 [Paracoccus yeei]|uniref:hypothetical protein n=1 Tax=Paracoccus yeei TaxID=147645 RepID=UPI003BF78400